jgi:hypothetical protein
MVRKDSSSPKSQPETPARKPRGRPVGSGHDDDEATEFMVDLLARGKAVDKRDAIWQAADRFPGHSPEATRKRLARKLDAHPSQRPRTPEELAKEAQRDEILRKAFEEDVAWDL